MPEQEKNRHTGRAASNTKTVASKSGKATAKSKAAIAKRGRYHKPAASENVVEEEAMPTKERKSVRNDQGMSVLSLSRQKGESQMTTMEKMQATQRGISKKELVQLKENAGLDYDQLAYILGVARATLISKNATEKFSTGLGEKIMSLAGIYSYGYEVFGNKEAFNQWIFQPLPGLGGKRPYELLSNQYGREEVFHVIGRIAYGVYS